MRCPTCGQESEPKGFSQTFECPVCGAVHLASQGQAAAPRGRAGPSPPTPSADAARLAQIQARAAQERLAKVAQVAGTPPGDARAIGGLSGCWVPWALTFLLGVAGLGFLALPSLVGNPSAAGEAGALERLAEAGEPGAQLALALIHDYGFGGEAGDAKQARRWYQRAAEGGSASAQYYLGKWYLARAPDSDRTDGIHWLRQAAEKGQVEAQFLLGELYRTGNDVAKDLTLAATWYSRAADQGSAEAMCRLARLHSGVEAGYSLDPPVAAMHDHVARELGKDCALPVSGYGASAALADWAKREGVRLGQERLAKGFTRRPAL